MHQPSLAVLRGDALFQQRYRIVRCLRAGGMGAVYEVMDERTDASRALKIMLPGIVENPDMRARFAREARITGTVESEHIVRTTDAGVDEETGTPFLVMELLRGEDLGGLLAKRRSLPPRDVVLYLFQAALALDKTHAAGIVHRDLKPENLFVTRRDDGSPCIKILDFGIAKLSAPGGRTTKSIGTPLYMPPEQMSAKGSIGPRADVYALGQIAYTLLVGAPYWDGEWRESEGLLGFFAEVARGVREPANARALRHGVELPTAFAGWFLKTTAVHADDRFEGASAAIGALAEALAVPLPRPSVVDGEPRTDPAALPGHPTVRAMASPAGGPTEPLVPDAPSPTVGGSRRASASRTGDPAPWSLSRLAPAVVATVLAGLVAVAFFAGQRGSGGAVEPSVPAQSPDAAAPSPTASPSLAAGPPRAAPSVALPAPSASASASSARPRADSRAASPPPATAPAPQPAHEGFF